MAGERGSYLKKWTDRQAVALLYPNSYKVGMSSLGFQLVYNILNEQENIVCERFFLPEAGEPFLSMESGRPLADFATICISISFEHDYVHLVQMLMAGGIAPFARDRAAEISVQSPLVICGGVVSFMNPEPLAPFVDLFYVGEAEPLFVDVVQDVLVAKDRHPLLADLARRYPGCYVPELYQPLYDESGRQSGYDLLASVPERIQKITYHHSDRAAHSQLLTKEAEFSDLYLTELGRGCSRGCRFCTAGFIYRPPRLWDADAIIAGIEERFEGVERVGLLGMEMAHSEDLDRVSEYLLESGCALSFSSLRADRLSSDLVDLLGESKLKSVAIAPDGSSERLRLVINKGLDESDLLNAAERLVAAGIFKLKLYLMVGLPTETLEDLQEAVELVGKIKQRIDPIGKARGRLCEIVVSANSFAPKPWTPFQYHPFGLSEALAVGESVSTKDAVANLKGRIKFLKKGFAQYANVSVNSDKPEHVLFQAVLSRGDRRIADVLYTMASSGMNWKQAMKKHQLTPEQYITSGYDQNSFLPWRIIDHGIKDSYLWAEYCKSFKSKQTIACQVGSCRRCGVCGEGEN